MTSLNWSETLNGILQYQLFMVNQTPITIVSLGMFLAIVVIFFVISKVIKDLLPVDC
jgi:hypothetical protein